MRAERPALVHLHSGRAHALGAAAARLAGVRPVVASRRVVVAPGRDPASRLKYALPVDRWLCVSAAVRDAMRDAGIPESRLTVVPSGVDLVALRARAASAPAAIHELRKALALEPAAPILVTVASLTAEKNHAMLLDVADRLRGRAPDARLVWVGEGPERAALEHARRARGLDRLVHLIGRRDDAPALIAGATLMLVASRHEGFCTAALEAQALGVPVIATRVGGLPEVVRDGETGILVEPGSAGTMADAIVRVLTAPGRRAAMGEAGRANAAGFDASRTAELTLANYQEVVRSRV